LTLFFKTPGIGEELAKMVWGKRRAFLTQIFVEMPGLYEVVEFHMR
jgi:hypothetical protein